MNGAKFLRARPTTIPHTCSTHGNELGLTRTPHEWQQQKKNTHTHTHVCLSIGVSFNPMASWLGLCSVRCAAAAIANTERFGPHVEVTRTHVS